MQSFTGRIAAVLSVLSLLCLATPVHADDATNITVSLAAQNLAYLPLYIAIDKGLFTKRGLHVTKSIAGSGANGVAAVISGSSTFSMQDPMTAVIARSKGAKIMTIGAVMTGTPVWLIVKKSSPVKALPDLAGKTIATATPPNVPTYLLEELLTKRNIGAKTMQVLLGTEIAPLLADKADAANLGEPFLEEALAQDCRIVYNFSTIYHAFYLYTAVDALDATLAQNPDMVTKFLAALAEAQHILYSDQETTQAIALQEFPGLPPDVVKNAVKRLLDEGLYARSPVIAQSAFDNALQLQVAVGNIKAGEITFKEYADTALAGRAMR